MKVPYKIVCAPVAIRYMCPHCKAEVESKWSVEKIMVAVTICPKCGKPVKLGEGETL